jgi:hypothetical protein
MPGVYRPRPACAMHAARHPERMVLNRVLFHSFDRVQAEYESHFERKHNYFRPIIKEAVERYLDCGNPKCGFARHDLISFLVLRLFFLLSPGSA